MSYWTKDSAMVSHCANPACRAPFLYFSEGKLIVVKQHFSSAKKAHIEFFWLCNSCAGTVDLEGMLAVCNDSPESELIPLSAYQQCGESSRRTMFSVMS
jgi:hypothetical protein